jgi:hypothetical protein
MPSWGPKQILGDNGKLTGIELVRCTSVFDEEGYFCPTFANIIETVMADQLILAIGQATDLTFVDDTVQLRVENGLIVIDETTFETNTPGFFAGGDVAKSPGSIIDAIAAGRRAASSIDTFLGGDGRVEETFIERPASQPYTGKRGKGFADLKRAEMPTLPLSERHDGFFEVELGFNDDLAIEEAKRCLQCDLELRLAEETRQKGNP